MELLKPTVPIADRHALPDDAAATVETETESESRGESGPESPQASPKARRRRSAPTGKTKPRNVHLTDDVHDRLWMLARQRRTTVSAVANDLLDKALPRWEVKRAS
jgi:hypothetical protein